MSAEIDLNLVHRVYEALNAQDLEAHQEFWHEDMIWHGPPGFGDIAGLDGYRNESKKSRMPRVWKWCVFQTSRRMSKERLRYETKSSQEPWKPAGRSCSTFRECGLRRSLSFMRSSTRFFETSSTLPTVSSLPTVPELYARQS